MAAVVGSPDDVVLEVLESRRQAGGQIWAANFNAPGQLVVAGATVDIEWLASSAREVGLRRVIPLKVAGAFHSPFMEPAAAALQAAVAGTTFADPAAPVYANATAAPGGEIAESLVSQLTSPVRFVETLEAMAATGIGSFVHVGPGDVTAGLAKKTVKDATVVTVSDLNGVAEAVAELSAG